ncbi:CheR family methyltransferase [Alkalihalobacillus pseudalcaliphilus]|uniref:CheR family methyltransferase n=1 Tax=Alkalihalobacillus pseudalcaliphilus TaxID=79884 RepID=UPI00064DB070|nr:protein-glutamate O-methyltransferase CheR [Alkalihalobacillus pseudalcaliphilus]KMK76440.1 chemotaxis protein CheR [Alkalihalobacillus pseudalcaliphilus]
MDKDYQEFISHIHKLTGINLGLYKETQMKRRLTTLRNKHGFTNFHLYFQHLKTTPTLLTEFLERMTINVSEFYRNQGRWHVLETKILPQLIEKNRPLKVWSAACSSGEEAYTLAMILSDLMPLQPQAILATDLDEQILVRAKTGIYLERAIKEVPIEKQKRYFKQTEWGYQVDPKLQAYIRFEKQNLLSDRFDKQYDLIVCRNVMIYFTEEAKHTLYQKFAEALRPGGILFVGSTEQIFQAKQYGLEADETFFYRKL